MGFCAPEGPCCALLCLENVVCWTLSVKCHFETKHEKTLKDEADKAELIKRAVSRYEQQGRTLKVFATAKLPKQATALCIALQNVESCLLIVHEGSPL